MSSSKPPAPAPSIPIPLFHARTLLTTFTYFLTTTLHTILFHRGLYPARTFLSTKAYNLPVHQSRHPSVCAWINDALAAVQTQLATGAVSKICFVVHGPAPAMSVVERWVFDVSSFPEWDSRGKGKGRVRGEMLEMERRLDEEARDQEDDDESVNWVDVDEALRGALRRVSYAAEKKGALPGGCTFTLAVELRDEAPAPIGHPQPWIPSESSLQPPPATTTSARSATTTPLRSVEAGPLFFECWVEEGITKAATSQNKSQGSEKS